MNPVRIIAPAILSGYHEDIWLLYWTAEFVGSALVAAVYKEKFKKLRQSMLRKNRRIANIVLNLGHRRAAEIISKCPLFMESLITR